MIRVGGLRRDPPVWPTGASGPAASAPMPNPHIKMRRALISVSDKTSLVDFAHRLVAIGFQLVSTGGTLRALQKAGVAAVSITDVTGHPEVFGGRVKTLHPSVHGGILFRRGHGEDEAARRELGIEPIDLVVVNLYPFRETVAREGVKVEEAVEQIDIGGPTLVRAAAKNFAHVGVVVDPADYDAVAEELEGSEGSLSAATRQRLALAAFEHTARYDLAIGAYLRGVWGAGADALPDTFPLVLETAFHLRYGENPHQSAALYTPLGAEPLGGGESLQGKPLSYNNILDLSGALEAVAEFEDPAAVIVKHTNPCGVGISESGLDAAYERALAGDPVSAFGGIVALNGTCGGALASAIASRFYEVVAAPDFSGEAVEILAGKKALRVIRIDPAEVVARQATALRTCALGVLAQTPDSRIDSADESAWRVATRRPPTDDEMAALRFVWRVVKHVKSNAIVIGSSRRTFGVGAGQMSRVDAVRLALSKSTGGGEPAVLASDAFFPFRDNIDVAAEGGIKAIIQPGGSRRDQEVIDAADEHGMAMIVTGRRHFRH